MELKDAVQLITHIITHNDFSPINRKVWADLGCGSGTFTLALASILDSRSSIYAVDSNTSILSSIPAKYNNTSIKKITTDFIVDDMPFNNLDGLLMANSLHYVKEKEAFVTRLKSYLNPDACFLVIEYDSNTSNLWVPYPLDFYSLKTLFTKLGYVNISKLNTRASIYGNRLMYSALIKP